MRRTGIVGFTVLALCGLLAAPAQASGPTFFFQRGEFAVAFWTQSVSATEEIRTGIAFNTDYRAYPSPPPDRWLTFLSYARETYSFNGTTWEITSAVYASAHSDLGDVIEYTIGPGARTISASATAEVRECVPSWPNCTTVGHELLEATWTALPGSQPRASGHHVTEWGGSGCEIDFASGSVMYLPASASATLGGVPPSGTPAYTEIERFTEVEVNYCLPG